MALQKNSTLKTKETATGIVEVRKFDYVKRNLSEQMMADFEMNHIMAKRLLNNKYDNKCVITKVQISASGLVEKIYMGTTSNAPVITMTRPDEKFNKKVEIKNKNNDDSYRVKIEGTKTFYVYYPEVIQVEYRSNSDMVKMTRKGCWLKEGQRIKYTQPADTEGWIHLPGASVWGPSNEKEGNKFFFADTRSNDVWWTLIDGLTGGAYKYFLSRKQSSKKILKNASRLNMFGATMEKFAEIDLRKYRVAIATCNFDSVPDVDKETEERLKSFGIDFGVCINDGKDYLLADFLAETLGCKVEEALLLAVQNRANYVQTKCLGQNLKARQMDILLDNLIALYGSEDIKVYGNPEGPIALIADANATKLVNVEALQRGDVIIDVYGLAIAKASNSRTSGQLIAKLLEKDYDAAVERICELMEEACNQMFSERLLNSKFDPKAGLNNNTAAMLGKLAINDEGFMWSNLNEMVTFAKSAIADLKINLDSVYNHAMFDDCFVMSRGIVEHILKTKDCGEYGTLLEVFSKDVCVYFMDEIEEIENSSMTDEEKEIALDELLSSFIIKYPSAGAEEYLGVRFLTMKEWQQRVETAKQQILDARTSHVNYLLATGAHQEISKVEAEYDAVMELFADYCNQIPYGVTLFAGYNFIKNKLAGMDVDFDATLAIFDKIKTILLNKDAVNVLTFIDYEATSQADYGELESKRERANLNFGK